MGGRVMNLPRGDTVLWLGIGACAGALAAVSPLAVTSAAASVAIALVLRTDRRWSLVLVALAFMVGLGRAHHAVVRHEMAQRDVVGGGTWPARCVLEGVVTRAPTVIGGILAGGLRVEIEAHAMRCERGTLGETAGYRVTLHVPLEVGVSPVRGDLVTATASLAPPYRFWNDGTGDPRPGAARRRVVLSGGAEDLVVVRAGMGIGALVDRARGHLRERIVATFPPETEAMARALVLGEDDLAEADQRAFRRSGLAHLLAVSGMHLVLVVLSLVAVVRGLLVRVPCIADRLDVTRIASAVGLPVAWLYADLAGGSGSAVRAAWMCTALLLARALDRRSAPWRALGLSVLVMVAIDPLAPFDVSFLLSALATAGLVGLSRPIEEGVRARMPWLPGFVRKPLATTAAATIACAPVLATMAPELPLGGLVANVVAVPLGEAAALPLCLVHGVLEPWPAAEHGCALAASGALVLVRLVARAFTWGALPVPPPTAFELAAMVAFAGAAALAPAGKRRPWLLGGAVALVGLELVVRARGAPTGALRVTFLDVGQGDSALVDLPDGSAILVDGGGLVGSPIDVGERAVGALLAARRRSFLSAVVLSHPHPDHFLGLTSALARTRTAAFWDTGQGEAEGAAGPYAELLRSLRVRGVPVLRPRELCGARNVGGASVEVLAPCPDIAADRGANDNSFVLRIRYGERSFLFVGDAEHVEESELVARFPEDILAADVLKVGHHGSRTSSTPAFLARVRPRVAVISCGVRNRFGHPHASTLGALEGSGARVLRTDRDGSVVITTDGRSLDVRTLRER